MIIGGDVCVNYTIFFIGKTREFKRVKHTPQELEAFKNYILELAQGEPITIYIEQTGRYSLPVIKALHDIATIKVVEGKKLKAFRDWKGIDVKDDYKDAELLYYFGELGGDAQAVNYEAYEIRGLVKRIFRIEKLKQASVNRIRQAVAVLIPEEYKYWDKDRLESFRNLDKLKEKIEQVDTVLTEIKQEALYEIETLRLALQEEKRLRKRVKNFTKEFPSYKEDFEILTSIPFIGEFRALVLIASYMDINRFPNVKKFIKYLKFCNT